MEKEGGGDVQYASYGAGSTNTTALKPGAKSFAVDNKNTKLDLEAAAYRESQETLWKRVLVVAPLSALGYAAAEKAMKYYMKDKPPHIAIWGMRIVENLHSVAAFVNAVNAVRTAGRLRNLDYIYSMEVGYYFYEMSKVEGLDKVHHLISIYAYICLLFNTRFNNDQEAARFQNLYKTMIMCLLHFAEPWKDLARYVALTRFQLLSKVIWIAHHIFYTFRIALWPAMFAVRPYLQPNVEHWYSRVPKKCLVGSVIFFALNIIWMYRKLAKFAWPNK